MFLIVRLLRWVGMLIALWAVLVYGLPAARGVIPRRCAGWQLQGGFCGEGAQRALANLDSWVARVLRPLPRHARVQQALADVREAVMSLENLARDRVGEERVNQALRGADVALQKLEDVVGGTGDAKQKLADVPENAQVLLGRLRDTFGRLRNVLSSTGRRAEEVSTAVEETKKALDALSNALPGVSQ